MKNSILSEGNSSH